MLGDHSRQLAICAVLWTSSAALAIAGTFRMDIRLMFWAILLTLVSCVITGRLVAITAACEAARDERLKVEDLATIMANVAAAERVPRIHS